MKLVIKEYSHSYWLDCGDAQVRRLVWSYLVSLTSKKKEPTRWGQMEEKYHQTYAVKTPCERYVGILKPCLKELLEFAKWRGIPMEVEIEKQKLHEPMRFECDLKDGVAPKDKEQELALEFVMREDANYSILECKTGFGKTFAGLVTSSKKGMRTAYMMQASHIKTWLKDSPKFINADKNKDYAFIQGRDKMKNLINIQKAGKLKAKYIYIAAETFREYLKAYENGEPYCDVDPLDFWEFFEIGRVVRDEAHEAVYELTRQTIYLNVHDLLALSATIVASDKFTKNIHRLLFPVTCRWKSSNNKHIDAISVQYNSEHGLKLKCANGYGYNHGRYEKNFMKNARLRREYFKMLTDVMSEFDRNGKEGMKTLTFFYLKDMCHLYKRHLDTIYPNKKNVAYVQESSKDDLYEGENIVSTLGSAGTGVDIPDLARGYNTVAIGSQRKAWQAMGRLRELKNYKDEYPKWFYFSNMSLPAHRKFESMRRFDLLDKTRSTNTMRLGTTITKWG